MRGVFLSKKAESDSGGITRLRDAIIILLVIALMIFAISKFGGLDFLKNLPGFGGNNAVGGEKVEGDLTYSGKCPVAVAIISDDSYVSFCKNAVDSKCEEPVKSTIKFNSNKIEVYKSGLARNVQIGRIVDSKISLYTEIITRTGSLYSSVPELYPFYDSLLNLNGAYFFSKSQICRDEKAVPAVNVVNREMIGSIGPVQYSYLLTRALGKIKSVFVFVPKEVIYAGSRYALASDNKETGLYFKDNNIMAGEIKIGSRNGNKIIIDNTYLAPEKYNNLEDVKNNWIIPQLNNANIVGQEIYAELKWEE